MNYTGLPGTLSFTRHIAEAKVFFMSAERSAGNCSQNAALRAVTKSGAGENSLEKRSETLEIPAVQKAKTRENLPANGVETGQSERIGTRERFLKLRF